MSNLNIESFCSMCLSNDINLQTICDINYKDKSMENIIFMLTEKLINFDGNSKLRQICASCLTNFKKFYDFRTLCRESIDKCRKVEIAPKNADKSSENSVPLVTMRRSGRLRKPETQPPPSIPEARNFRSPSSFHCKFCDKTFEKLANLEIHRSMDHHNEQPKFDKKLICKFCQKTFTGANGLKNHIEKIHGPQRGNCVCKICKKRFKDNSMLAKHEILHDPIFLNSIVEENLKFKCVVCLNKFNQDIEFNNKEHLQSHYKKHGNDEFNCPRCRQSFHTLTDYSGHLKIHPENAPYKCIICGQLYFYKMRFIDHLLKHQNRKLYQCDNCNRGFSQLPKLRDHMLTHSDVKMHLCSVCGKSFKTKENLTRHLFKHRGIKNVSCDQCPSKFFFKSKTLD